jgi:rare lipoprotein A
MNPVRVSIIVLGLSCAAAMLPLDLAKADQVGHASWYDLHSRTASGEQMDPSAMTAAHRSLPFGTKVLVENLSNGRSVVVRINDRGPFVGGRIIDVSKAAASTLGMLGSGTAQVRVTVAGKSPATSDQRVAGGLGGLMRSAPKVAAVAARERVRKNAAVALASPLASETRRGTAAPVVLASASAPYGGVLGRSPGFME